MAVAEDWAMVISAGVQAAIWSLVDRPAGAGKGDAI